MRIRFRSKWIWLLGILGVILLFGFLMISRKQGREPETKRAVIEAQIITLGLEEVPIYRETTGVVASASQATLASKVSGLVEEIRVREGDQVKAGDVLIILDSRDLQAQLERATAELENASVNYQRMKKLYAEESVARQELDNAERTYKVAESTRKAIEANLAYTTIKAPFNGVIVEKMIEVGELATPGRSLLRLEDNRHLRLEVTVAETDIRAIHLGEKVSVRLDALEDQDIPGRIARILPAADPSTHSFLVKADLPPRPGLKTGLFGRMLLLIGSRKALMLPRSSALEKGELARVYAVNEEGIAQSRLVKLGKIYGDRVEVLSGLEPGERILARAEENLEGKLVRPPREGGP